MLLLEPQNKSLISQHELICKVYQLPQMLSRCKLSDFQHQTQPQKGGNIGGICLQYNGMVVLIEASNI